MSKTLKAVILELFTENGLDQYDLNIQESSGIVTLSGRVDRWDQVVLAGHLAGGLSGVKSLINRVNSPDSILPPDPVKPDPSSGTLTRADLVIIGAGVVGAALAREFSRFKIRIVLLDKESDVGCGASKANNGMVHSGIVQEPNSLRSRLNVRGNELYEEVCRDLDVPFKRCGLLTVVFREEDLFLLELTQARGEAAGIPVEVISRERALELEPSLSPDIKGAFLAPSTAMTSPYKLTVAYAENAVMNGVNLYLDTAVTGFHSENGRLKKVYTTRGAVETPFCINAAGIYADRVAAMAGKEEFTLHPRKGELILFDSAHLDNHPRIATGVLAIGQDPYTKGGGTMITTEGNPEWGPTAFEVPDREDTAVTADGLDRIIDKFSRLIPDYDPHKALITFFAGLRAATYTEDFHIRPSGQLNGLLNVAGIQSPGLAAVPAITEMVLDLAGDMGLKLEENPAFQPLRKSPPRFRALNLKARKKLIGEDHRYGQIVCRCEQVTEGEVIAALNRPVPVTTLDAIKRRTRAGMGRCQGSFCLPRLALIMARELGVPIHKLTKSGPGSPLFSRPTKLEALTGEGDAR